MILDIGALNIQQEFCETIYDAVDIHISMA